MTGPQHYRKAEQLLAAAAEAVDWPAIVERAQVHATLALAAATAEPAELDGYDMVNGTSFAQMDKRSKAWREAFDATEPGS